MLTGILGQAHTYQGKRKTKRTNPEASSFFSVTCNFVLRGHYLLLDACLMEFHELYEHYAPDLHRFAGYLCGDWALAEDIVSETFMRAWTSSAPIRQATVKAYLFTIARHVYFEHRRKVPRMAELDETVPDASPSPYAAAAQASELSAIGSALARLPELDRTVLLLRIQGELPYEEMASALGLSLAAVKLRVHRAKLRLAALIERPAEAL